MLIGDFLYQLSDKEAVSQPTIQRFIRRNSTSSAAVSVSQTAIVDVPLDQIAIITAFSLRGSAGAGQTTTSLLLRIVAEGPAFTNIYQYRDEAVSRFNAAASQLIFDVNEVGVQLLLMPREQLEVHGEFSAAVNANLLESNIHGFFLPRGSLQHR